MDNFLQNMSVFSVLLPLFTGLLFWKYQEANARIMVLLLVFASFSQLGGTYITVDRNLIYNLYLLIDASLWALIFYRNTTIRYARIMILILYSVLFIYALYSFYFKGIHNRFYSELVCLNSGIQVVCVLIYFYDKYFSEKILKLKEDPLFWFCLGILFYAPCTYFLFAFRYYLEKDVFDTLIPIHHVLNTLLYFLITVGFLVRVKKIKYLLKWN